MKKISPYRLFNFETPQAVGLYRFKTFSPFKNKKFSNFSPLQRLIARQVSKIDYP